MTLATDDTFASEAVRGPQDYPGCTWQPNPYRGMVLNLGCGARPIVEAVNHDRVEHGPWVDVAFDLDRMPWADLCPGFDVIVALDLFEHLRDPYGAVNECHRLLLPGGLLVARMAAWDNPVSHSDLTHRHFVSEGAMDFFDRDTLVGAHYSDFHPVDSMGRLPTRWHIDGVDRVNPDPRWPKKGDWQFTMVRL